MPGYIARALQCFSHPTPSKPQHSPHAWQKPTYGTKVQYAPDPDTSPALNAADIKRVQEVLGTLFYYARAVDSTMLTAIGSIATQQTNGTHASHAQSRHPTLKLLRYAPRCYCPVLCKRHDS
jgi:hypothetical protein